MGDTMKWVTMKKMMCEGIDVGGNWSRCHNKQFLDAMLK